MNIVEAFETGKEIRRSVWPAGVRASVAVATLLPPPDGRRWFSKVAMTIGAHSIEWSLDNEDLAANDWEVAGE